MRLCGDYNVTNDVAATRVRPLTHDPMGPKGADDDMYGLPRMHCINEFLDGKTSIYVSRFSVVSERREKVH